MKCQPSGSSAGSSGPTTVRPSSPCAGKPSGVSELAPVAKPVQMFSRGPRTPAGIVMAARDRDPGFHCDQIQLPTRLAPAKSSSTWNSGDPTRSPSTVFSASRLAPPARTPISSATRGCAGVTAMARISRACDAVMENSPRPISTGAPPSRGVTISRARPVIDTGVPKPSGHWESIEVVRRTDPGRRGGAVPADWRASGNWRGAFIDPLRQTAWPCATYFASPHACRCNITKASALRAHFLMR